MIALVFDRADDGRLAVVPAVAGDAGLLANVRARAVGADQQPRRIVSPSAKVTSMLLGACANPVTAVPRRSMPSSLAFVTSASTSSLFSTMCANGSPSFHLAAKGQERRPHRVVELESVTTMSRIAAPAHQPRPQTSIASNSRRAAAAMADARGSFDWADFQRRIGDRHRKARAERLAQRDRQRQAGKAAPPITTSRLRWAMRLPCKLRPSIAG